MNSLPKWTPADTLLTMKRIISKTLCDKDRSGLVVLPDVISIDEDELDIMCRNFSKINSAEKFERYCICIITAWIYSYKLDRIEWFKSHMNPRYAKIPQHAKGRYVSSYEDTFHTYGLETFDHSINSLEDVEYIIKKHAKVI